MKDISSARIMVVDDSRVAQAAMENVLRGEGFSQLDIAGSAGEALEILGLSPGQGDTKTQPVDLILLDIIMPDMDGIKTCRVIKAAEHLRDIPVIMVTAREDLESLSQAFQAGAMDYITKPIVEVELVARIGSALALKREIDWRKQRERELLEITNELAQANHKLRQVSSMDGLTGVPNRRYFNENLDREWRRATRQGQSLGLVMVDIDQFKAYNDSYGHLEGDQCLAKVAEALAGGIKRAGDMVARYGGEEFVVLLPAVDADGARVMAEKLRRAVHELAIDHPASSVSKVVTVSLGVAAGPVEQGSGPEDLINAADQALYRAKANGCNRVELSPWPAGEEKVAS